MLVRPTLTIEATRLVHMGSCARDSVRRAALVVDLTVDGRPISVAGTHMSHLMFGSHRNWLQLGRQLKTEARADAVLVGRHEHVGAVGARVHPGLAAGGGGSDVAGVASAQPDRPHLGAGAIRSVRGAVLPDAGSDHRPVRAELEVG